MTSTRLLFALALVQLLSGCPTSSCPVGEVPVEGRCYPKEAVDAVGGGVPVLCASACEESTPNCDYHTGTCVACASASQCPSLAQPLCDPSSHECSPCAADADCARFGATPHCDVSAGRCVVCDEMNEASACGGYSCDAITGTCTTTLRHSRLPCDPCRADSECGQFQHCAAFSWLETPAQFVCLWDSTQMPCATSAASANAPYVHANDVTSVHGESVHVCEPPSVCQAVQSYTTHKSCSFRTDCATQNLAADCVDGHCTMSCSSILVGYQGCAASDNCDDNLYCRPNP